MPNPKLRTDPVLGGELLEAVQELREDRARQPGYRLMIAFLLGVVSGWLLLSISFLMLLVYRGLLA